MIVSKSLDVAKDIKHIHIICKLLGLAPYKITKGTFSEEIEIDYTVRNNIIVIVWTSVLALFLLICIIPTAYIYAYVANLSLSDNLNAFISIPMVSLVACFAIIMNLSINKRKITEFFTKISHIDNKLSSLNVKDSSTNYIKFQDNADILIFLFVLIPYCVYDTWLWITEDTFHIAIALRYGHVVNVSLTIHFCTCVKIIRKRLAVVCENTEEMRIPSLMTPQLRSLLGDICEAARILNSIYGPLILLEFTRLFMIVIVSLNSIVYLLNKSPLKALSLIIWKIMTLSELIYIILTCQMTVTKLKTLTFSIHNILFQKFHITVDVFQQFALFLHQISTCGLEFTACGLFKLDYPFLCSVLTSFISYAVIIYQFK
ncbi:hypothetical protein L9F63_001342 [Diploptera punctata]|uniref:Gustatory receptor n=1 Tax=Diploptera punctata TaxID=6984 RepID=A0AAD8A419_DIPPU|nr:hypothetical protein L9F63_001342 [Diploptera punctata]